MQSTPEKSAAAKMDANQMDSLKNGIEQNGAQVCQEETHLTENKVFLNGNALKEPAECDDHELNNDVIREKNVSGDPVVINSVNGIDADKHTASTEESNKDEKVFPSLQPEECSSENTVSNEEPKSSVKETAPLKPEVTQEADGSIENLPSTSKEDDVKEPEEPLDILGNGLLIKKACFDYSALKSILSQNLFYSKVLAFYYSIEIIFNRSFLL